MVIELLGIFFHPLPKPQSTVNGTIAVLSTSNQDMDLKFPSTTNLQTKKHVSQSKCNMKQLYNHIKSYEYRKKRTKPITHSYLTCL